MRLSAYARNLRDTAKVHYEQNVHLCGGIASFDFSSDEAVCDMKCYPSIEFTDIKDYLVDGTSFTTRGKLKAYKSMDAHNYVTSGWVQQPRVQDLGDGCSVVVGNDRRSQAIFDKPLEAWVLTKEDGEILNAHCICKAGLGEPCSHIAALLFYVEIVVRKKDGKVCTDEENAWLPPYVRHLEGKQCSDVSFASTRAKKVCMDAGKSANAYRQQRKAVEKTTDAEWSSFLAACHRSGSRLVLLSVHSTYAADFVPVAMRFPQAILTNLSKDEAPRTDAALREHCVEVMRTLSIELQVTTLVEAETREQAKSTKWFAFQAGRITASNAKAVRRTSIPSPSISLLKKVCYPQETQFWSPQTVWGKDHEEIARKAYASASASIHLNFKCDVSGLQISQEQSFLAATPDGLVSCTCCGDGVLEIKCPYDGRDGTVRELATSPSSCIILQRGELRLRTDHAYYYQVQLQMVLCKKNLLRRRCVDHERFCHTKSVQGTQQV
ncbi:hypothetical protein HPB51_003986 [Rhipicephalus microplus]|uniref:SWIM-type domain-containing protein n=1 Tax=Rhipicephalus microplus TaxID=6941 RepID=A0A9J6DTF5_RHIMP|nr:hypothetical protein HPB51_003986 [Rhipicephalus microplus]